MHPYWAPSSPQIIPNFMCQGGDFTNGNGTGGRPIMPIIVHVLWGVGWRGGLLVPLHFQLALAG